MPAPTTIVPFFCCTLLVLALSSLLPGVTASCDCDAVLSNAVHVPTVCGGESNTTRCSTTCNDARVAFLNSYHGCIGQICPKYNSAALTEAQYDYEVSRCHNTYNCCYSGLSSSSSTLSSFLLPLLYSLGLF